MQDLAGSCNDLCRILQGLAMTRAGSCGVLRGLAGSCRVLQGLAGSCRVLQGLARSYCVLKSYYAYNAVAHKHDVS